MKRLAADSDTYDSSEPCRPKPITVLYVRNKDRPLYIIFLYLIKAHTKEPCSMIPFYFYVLTHTCPIPWMFHEDSRKNVFWRTHIIVRGPGHHKSQ